MPPESLLQFLQSQMATTQAASTGVAHDKIDNLLSQHQTSTKSPLFSSGSISQTPEDKRNIIQKLADKLYESGPIGATAAAVADILPGIPFVDIIDPPHQLEDPQMQIARNLLGALSIPMTMKQAPKAVGRVATNIKAPFNYDISDVKPNIMYGGGKGKESYWAEPSMIKRIAGAIGRTTKSIIQDKPLYGKRTRQGNLFGDNPLHDTAVNDAREYLYRKTFGLKARKGTKIFKENKDGTLSFNPKSKRGKELVDQIKKAAERTEWAEADLPKQWPMHDVMGGYSLKLGKHTGFPMRDPVERTADFLRSTNKWDKRTERVKIPAGNILPTPSRYSNIKFEPKTSYTRIADYEDIWDFKMHPHEWEDIFKWGGKERRGLMAQAGLRTLMNMVTNPPTIKGTVPY
jgi:hypothetical protein